MRQCVCQQCGCVQKVIKWAASKRQTETPYTANESDQ